MGLLHITHNFPQLLPVNIKKKQNIQNDTIKECFVSAKFGQLVIFPKLCFLEFLSLWKDADPGMAEVEDARERVARLAAE